MGYWKMRTLFQVQSFKHPRFYLHDLGSTYDISVVLEEFQSEPAEEVQHQQERDRHQKCHSGMQKGVLKSFHPSMRVSNSVPSTLAVRRSGQTHMKENMSASDTHNTINTDYTI